MDLSVLQSSSLSTEVVTRVDGPFEGIDRLVSNVSSVKASREHAFKEVAISIHFRL